MGQDSQPFVAASTWHSVGDNRFAGHVAAEWSQGRAVYGGIIGAGVARCTRTLVAAEKQLRSFSMTFAGPIEAGGFECETELIREGRTATFVHARVHQGGTVRATASTTYGLRRTSSLRTPGPPRPEVAAPDDLESMPYIPGFTPAFTTLLDFRWARSSYPFTGSKDQTLGGWFRYRDAGVAADAAGVLGLVDAWPAPALPTMSTPAPASSITWHVDFNLTEDFGGLDEWWYFEGTTTFASDGYTSFGASIWNPDGAFVARSTQLVGVFG